MINYPQLILLFRTLSWQDIDIIHEWLNVRKSALNQSSIDHNCTPALWVASVPQRMSRWRPSWRRRAASWWGPRWCSSRSECKCWHFTVISSLVWFILDWSQVKIMFNLNCLESCNESEYLSSQDLIKIELSELIHISHQSSTLPACTTACAGRWSSRRRRAVRSPPWAGPPARWPPPCSNRPPPPCWHITFTFKSLLVLQWNPPNCSVKFRGFVRQNLNQTYGLNL